MPGNNLCINFYPYFQHLLSDLDEIWYKQSERNDAERL
jgi:hypothetical protein